MLSGPWGKRTTPWRKILPFCNQIVGRIKLRKKGCYFKISSFSIAKKKKNENKESKVLLTHTFHISCHFQCTVWWNNFDMTFGGSVIDDANFPRTLKVWYSLHLVCTNMDILNCFFFFFSMICYRQLHLVVNQISEYLYLTFFRQLLEWYSFWSRFTFSVVTISLTKSGKAIKRVN